MRPYSQIIFSQQVSNSAGKLSNPETNPSSSAQPNLKYNMDKQTFSRTYSKVDHLQRYLNDIAVKHYIQIITEKYNRDKRPLAIADLCCGYGLPTLTLTESLLKNGVQLSKVVGYDVSEEMIHFAKGNNTFHQVQFHRINVETEFNDINEYDVIISLFGLHWMNKIQSVAAKIHRSLKAGGLFLTLIYIDVQDLFDFRHKFVHNSKWSSSFSQSAKNIHPFNLSKDDYLIPFSKYFKTLHHQKKATRFNHTRQEFLTFLQSWLQQVRHLTNKESNESKKQQVARAYLEDFIDSIEKNLNGNVIVHQDGSIIFTEHTLDFDGEKI